MLNMRPLRIVGIALLLVGIAGCTQEGDVKNHEVTVRAVMDKVQEKMTSEDHHLMNIKSEEETKFFASAKHFNRADIKEGYILEPLMSTVESELIIVIKTADQKAMEQVKKALNKVLSDQFAHWEGYIPSQYELVKNNKIKQQGNFIIYATSKHVDDIIKVFQDEVR